MCNYHVLMESFSCYDVKLISQFCLKMYVQVSYFLGDNFYITGLNFYKTMMKLS